MVAAAARAAVLGGVGSGGCSVVGGDPASPRAAPTPSLCSSEAGQVGLAGRADASSGAELMVVVVAVLAQTKQPQPQPQQLVP
mmetsp:Transcript_86426/g.180954  ORF Transcript_86426/g.180954 Transcript_86426/m.180954 type:complete len:83 (-) Transcript_86426:235-483(-)